MHTDLTEARAGLASAERKRDAAQDQEAKDYYQYCAGMWQARIDRLQGKAAKPKPTKAQRRRR